VCGAESLLGGLQQVKVRREERRGEEGENGIILCFLLFLRVVD
jgi:hypothetical protein